MIFGFNTDVKSGESVYHVQSEAHESVHLLQTTVFQQGRLVGKRVTPYSEHLNEPDFSEEKMHQLLKQQHREVVEMLREGRTEILASVPSAK